MRPGAFVQCHVECGLVLLGFDLIFMQVHCTKKTSRKCVNKGLESNMETENLQECRDQNEDCVVLLIVSCRK